MRRHVSSSARARSSRRSRRGWLHSRAPRLPADPYRAAETGGSPGASTAVSVARVACRAQLGLHAPLVQVEVSLAAGLPAFCIVGLPATVIKESKERVRAAL